MTKKITIKISLYMLIAAVVVGSGAWLQSTFAGSANTGVLPESSGGTGKTNISKYFTDYAASLRPKINNASVSSTTSVYAPTSAGTANANQGLFANGGTSAPTWGAVARLQTTTGVSVSDQQVGTTIFAYVWGSEAMPAQNTTVTLYYRADTSFVINHAPASPGFQMSGTWASRGCINHQNNGWLYSCLVQRIG